jgi:hypothetical protein
MDLVYFDPISQKIRDPMLVEAVDTLIYKVRHKSLWEIFEFCFKVWAKKNPDEYTKYLHELAVYKKGRKNKFASTQNKSLRELVILPRDITYLLNKVALDRIEEYGEKKFYRELARRYPVFSPATSI